MVLEGTVTNVAAFGAFVDIGVHQDGLVHVSAMANTFVKDPRAVAKPGDVVKVKVLSVDVPRKRIALTMRLADPEGEVVRGGPAERRQGGAGRQRPGEPAPPRATARSPTRCDGRRRRDGGSAAAGATVFFSTLLSATQAPTNSGPWREPHPSGSSATSSAGAAPYR